MGYWSLHVQGHGIHDNGRPDDADQMFKEFVDDLVTKGHEIESAHFTVGSSREVSRKEK